VNLHACACDTHPSQQQRTAVPHAATWACLPGGEYYQLDGEAIGGRRVVRPYANLSQWQHQIRQMRWAVGLWEKCSDERLEKSARQQARRELQTEIESALRDVKTPCCARARLNQNMELYVYPVNLLAFLWLTLARLASGEIVEQECLACGEYIYTGIGPGLKKTGTTTCSDACRKSNSRFRERTKSKRIPLAQRIRLLKEKKEREARNSARSRRVDQ
jgi:hypothetical protein